MDDDDGRAELHEALRELNALLDEKYPKETEMADAILSSGDRAAMYITMYNLGAISHQQLLDVFGVTLDEKGMWAKKEAPVAEIGEYRRIIDV